MIWVGFYLLPQMEIQILDYTLRQIKLFQSASQEQMAQIGIYQLILKVGVFLLPKPTTKQSGSFWRVGTFGEASTAEMTAEAKETILTIQKVLSKL